MTAPLWTWRALCRALGLPEVDGPEVTGISIDSRSLQPGDLFIALRGDPGSRFNTSSPGARDGHDFVAAAVAAGAAGVLVDRDPGVDVPALQVADTLDGLWALGRAARARFSGPVIAITGSSGKTTAKTYLQALLDAHASVGSFNNFWGVPVSLARMPADALAGVFEIGMNAPGEIAPLAQLVRPDVALLLNVAPAHLGNFASLEGIRQEKLSIAEGLPDAGGVLVAPDDLSLDGMSERARTLVRFGMSAQADVRLLSLTGEAVAVQLGVEELQFRLPGGGQHRALSATAALACALAAGCGVHGREQRLAAVEPPPGRGRVHRVGELTVVDESYNANPLSTRLALETLATAAGRRVAVLGDMLELGDGEVALHAGLAAACAGLDLVICVGPRMQHLADALERAAQVDVVRAPDAGAFTVHDLRALLEPGDTVLVKGSNKVFWARGFVAELLAV